MQLKEKYDKWAFTSWKKPEIKLSGTVKYLTWQKEVCPLTKKEHYQGYVEFKKEYTLAYAKALFQDKTIYIDKAKCSQEVNHDYCSKARTRASDSEHYEFGRPSLDETLNDVFNLET